MLVWEQEDMICKKIADLHANLSKERAAYFGGAKGVDL